MKHAMAEDITMRHSTLLPESLLGRCTSLKNHSELQSFLEEVRSEFPETTPKSIEAILDAGQPWQQASALFYSLARGWSREASQLQAALVSDASDPLLIAASLCLVFGFPEEEDLYKQLLLSPNPWDPPKLGSNAHYYLIDAMRLSGNQQFVPILFDVVKENYHHCPRYHVLKALEELGARIDEDEKEDLLRSITVTPAGGSSRILITNDERYGGGSSNCIHCRFFPCRINRLYARGIEDCKLWNRIDPATLGEIEDMKGWGGSADEVVKVTPVESMLVIARDLLERGEARLALPHLCAMLTEADFTGTHQAVAWINLARGLVACDEPVLAFIFMREGAKLRNLMGASDRIEKEELARFVDDPKSVTSEQFSKDREHRLGLRAIGFKKNGRYTCALDCYAEANVREAGLSGGTWFEMGECHRELGEYGLAELCMRLGAHRSAHDITLREKFLAESNAVNSLLRLRGGSDPGLAFERRAADRAATAPLGDLRT